MIVVEHIPCGFYGGFRGPGGPDLHQKPIHLNLRSQRRFWKKLKNKWSSMFLTTVLNIIEGSCFFAKMDNSFFSSSEKIVFS